MAANLSAQRAELVARYETAIEEQNEFFEETLCSEGAWFMSAKPTRKIISALEAIEVFDAEHGIV